MAMFRLCTVLEVLVFLGVLWVLGVLEVLWDLEVLEVLGVMETQLLVALWLDLHSGKMPDCLLS